MDIQTLKNQLSKEKFGKLKAETSSSSSSSSSYEDIYYNPTAFRNAWYLLYHRFQAVFIFVENKSEVENRVYGDCSKASEYCNKAWS